MRQRQHPLQILINITLFMLCVFFSVLLWQELNKPAYLKNVTATLINEDRLSNEKTDNKELVFQDIAEFDEIIQRPLFNETRQPFIAPETGSAVKKPTAQSKKSPKEQFMLSAVVITPDKRIAVLQNSKDKTLQRIALGETFNGWILNEITSHSVKLTKGKQIKNLELEIKKSTPKKKAETITAQKTGGINPQAPTNNSTFTKRKKR